MTKSNQVKDLFHVLLTNLPPRRTLSRWMGHLSRYQSRTWTRLAIWIWQRFDPLELQDSPPCQYNSLHECFIRPLKPGVRQIDADPQVLSSPCDGILGAFGRIQAGQLHQIKGRHYRLDELLGPVPDSHPWQNGYYMTIRIKSSMYHRFHAPAHGALQAIRYFTGDAYNVTPATLRWIDRLFCKNERACLTYQIGPQDRIALIPVAAILVAGIRLHAVPDDNWMGHGQLTPLTPPQVYEKGQEMGWFEHGSTIVIVTSERWQPLISLKTGDRLHLGQAVFELADPAI